MRRRQERIRLEQEKVHEANFVASESGYETTCDHMVSATTTPAQSPLKKTTLAISRELKENQGVEEEGEEEEERGEEEEGEREEEEGGDESNLVRTEEPQVFQAVGMTKPGNMAAQGWSSVAFLLLHILCGIRSDLRDTAHHITFFLPVPELAQKRMK